LNSRIPDDAFGLGEILDGNRYGTIAAVTAIRYASDYDQIPRE
jgi:hypothetical protein